MYSISGKVFLSGVGQYDNPEELGFTVPRDPSKTYKDLGPGGAAAIAVSDLDWGELDESEWGFIFHDTCWELLDALYGMDEVPLDRLHIALDSLTSPVIMLGLSWGHTFGDLYIKKRNDASPWTGRFCIQKEETQNISEARSNPFHIPKLQHPHSGRPAPSPFRPLARKRREGNEKDPLTKLPREIISMVSWLLPVRDVARAREASWAFVGVFHDQQFWRARFEPRGERAWLFEARLPPGDGEDADWRVLYRQKDGRNLCLQELNRARIWPILEEVRDILSLEWTGPSSPLLSPWRTGRGETCGHDWLTVGADILETPRADFSPSSVESRIPHPPTRLLFPSPGA